MSTTTPPKPLAEAALPAVPLTIEGSSVLHQVMRLRRPDWRALPPDDRRSIGNEAASVLTDWERLQNGWTAIFSLLGHKGDLLFVHFRPAFDDLHEAQTQMSRLRLFDYFEPAYSYVSVVELGLYESTIKLYGSLADRGVAPHSPEWNAEVAGVTARQREAMYPRLYPEMPQHRYICFYPMDRKRGEDKNWYQVEMRERGRMMHEHGLVGRRYAGEVRQIITGSIGFDDWEWGVDLFADDPLVFKRLIYEMRFDEVSAVYALFGSFYVGIRCPAGELVQMLG